MKLIERIEDKPTYAAHDCVSTQSLFCTPPGVSDSEKSGKRAMN